MFSKIKHTVLDILHQSFTMFSKVISLFNFFAHDITAVQFTLKGFYFRNAIYTDASVSFNGQSSNTLFYIYIKLISRHYSMNDVIDILQR